MVVCVGDPATKLLATSDAVVVVIVVGGTCSLIFTANDGAGISDGGQEIDVVAELDVAVVDIAVECTLVSPDVVDVTVVARFK